MTDFIKERKEYLLLELEKAHGMWLNCLALVELVTGSKKLDIAIRYELYHYLANYKGLGIRRKRENGTLYIMFTSSSPAHPRYGEMAYECSERAILEHMIEKNIDYSEIFSTEADYIMQCIVCGILTELKCTIGGNEHSFLAADVGLKSNC